MVSDKKTNVLGVQGKRSGITKLTTQTQKDMQEKKKRARSSLDANEKLRDDKKNTRDTLTKYLPNTKPEDAEKIQKQIDELDIEIEKLVERIEVDKTMLDAPDGVEGDYDGSNPQSTEASNPQSTEASNSQSTEASNPQSTEASNSQSTEASNPQSTEASNPQNQFQSGGHHGHDEQVNIYNARTLEKAFREGLSLRDDIKLYTLSEAESRPTQATLGYKRGSRTGRVAIVAENDVYPDVIYRIRRDIFIDPTTVDIIQTRRTGTGVLGKGDRGNIKWTSDDIDGIVGIAIEVPPGYAGYPEELVLPLPKMSATEKEKITASGRKLPVQADVQLIIKWKESKVVKGISEEYIYSFESRAGCSSIFGTQDKANKILYEVAKKVEKTYRNKGGKYSVEARLPEFKTQQIQALTPIVSRAGSEEPEETTEGEKERGNKETEEGKKEGEKVSAGGDKEKDGGKENEQEKKNEEKRKAEAISAILAKLI